MENSLTTQQQEQLNQEISPVVERANALVIKTAEESIQAQEGLKEIKTKQKKIEAFFKNLDESSF